MPTWNQLLNEFQEKNRQAGSDWLVQNMDDQMETLSRLRGGSNVLVYASGFLQKPSANFRLIGITSEDINGLMPTVHGMDWTKPLSLVLHTPGGEPGAAETMVDYLRTKFDRIEVVVPTLAMSAGTMIALCSDEIVMGRQSQLGPIDPQILIPTQGRYVAAGSVVDQFEEAKNAILENPGLAHLWAPITQTLGYGFLQDAENSIEYAKRMVEDRLKTSGLLIGDKTADAVADWFATTKNHRNHGARISIDAARSQGLNITPLEDNQELQEAVLSLYHLLTIAFEQTSATKIIMAPGNRRWVKTAGEATVPPG